MSTPAVQPFFHEGTGTWSYVVHQDGDAVLIDPVLDYDPKSGRIATESSRALLAYVRDQGLRVQRILETHAHADHLTGAAFLRAATHADVAIGAGIRDVQAHFAAIFGWDTTDPDLRDAFGHLLRDGDVLQAGALRIEAMDTPGHTADSLSYSIGDNVFVGDTVFAPDVGTARCDFPGGSVEQLHASIQRLYALPDDTTLWLCHDYPVEGRAPRASVSVGESATSNRMLRRDTTLQAFAEARRKRDAGLPAPQLLYPSLQVNIRGGKLPPEEAGGHCYLRTPVHVDGASDGLR